MNSVPIVRMPVQPIIYKNPVNKERKPRAQWCSQYQLVWVNCPTPTQVKQGQRSSKLFKIRVQYKDQKGEIHYKTVRFGDQSDFVFNHDKEKRANRFSHFSHQNDPFHPNYWRLHLLNTYPTMKQAYTNFISQVLQNKTIDAKLPK